MTAPLLLRSQTTSGLAAGAAYVMYGKTGGFPAVTEMSSIAPPLGYSVLNDIISYEYFGMAAQVADVTGDVSAGDAL